jgi:hypothetical protein
VVQVGGPAQDEGWLSAEVVLRGSAGAPHEAISSSNLAQHQPDQSRAGQIRDWFRRRGFATTGVHGISFSITGPRQLFEETCATTLEGEGARPGVDVVELPAPTDMPGDLGDDVVAVTFTPPPDFGPGSY